MKKTEVAFVVLFLIFFSCKQEKRDAFVANEQKTPLIKERKDSLSTGKEETKDTVYISMGMELPKDRRELESWKRQAKKGNKDKYLHLSMIWKDMYNISGEEMAELAEIMIRKTDRDPFYLYDYFYFVFDSQSKSTKDKLMGKAICYLKEALSKSPGSESLKARRPLAYLYREGVYVEKDTVIANYLNSGGVNIDSIISVRKKLKYKSLVKLKNQ